MRWLEKSNGNELVRTWRITWGVFVIMKSPIGFELQILNIWCRFWQKLAPSRTVPLQSMLGYCVVCSLDWDWNLNIECEFWQKSGLPRPMLGYCMVFSPNCYWNLLSWDLRHWGENFDTYPRCHRWWEMYHRPLLLLTDCTYQKLYIAGNWIWSWTRNLRQSVSLGIESNYCFDQILSCVCMEEKDVRKKKMWSWIRNLRQRISLGM